MATKTRKKTSAKSAKKKAKRTAASSKQKTAKSVKKAKPSAAAKTKAAPTRSSRAKLRPFVKMQAVGNDMIILDGIRQQVGNPPHFARKLCTRRLGIGADQLILLSTSRTADFGARFFNADGSEAEMCGNGIRCLARYVKDAHLTQKKTVTFETNAGVKEVHIRGKIVEVDMGEPRMKGKEIPVNLSGRVINRPLKLETKEFRITCLSVGNPHCVIFQEHLEDLPVPQYGPLVEHHHIFPKRANVEFVNVVSRNEIHMRVWERGAGETQGCGTGACAAAIASVLNGFTGRTVTVHQPGGKLEIEWNRKDNHIVMRGGAELVFTGEIAI